MVQSIAFVLDVRNVVLSFCLYFTGWTSFVVLRWHMVHSRVLLCFSRFFIVAFVPGVPWQPRQNNESIDDGFESVLLWILPDEWHEEQPGFVAL